MPENDWYHKGYDGNGEAAILFFGEFPAPAQAESFFAEVRDIRAPKTVNVFINSLGGDVFTAFAIANRLRDWQSKGARVVCEVAGVAGSAAAIVAAAADELMMPEDGFLFLHRAAYVDGRPANERLVEMNDAMARRFAEKTGRGKDEMLALLSHDGRWLNAAEATALGFADAIGEEGLRA